MAADLDLTAIRTAFDVPRSDGAFDEPTLAYLRKLGALRPMVILAFAPKGAGTFYREVAIDVLGGHLFRAAYAQGGRDACFYMPSFIAAFLDKDHPRPVVHVHMQALPANRFFIEAFDLKPVIMLRNLPDLLVSYLDMLETDVVARYSALNCLIPDNFLKLSSREKIDFAIDIICPWYASYFATWKDYSEKSRGRVLVQRYTDFRSNPATSVYAALCHSGHSATLSQCEDAVKRCWSKREKLRFNKGASGRGRTHFSASDIERITRQLSHYRSLREWMPDLIGESLRDREPEQKAVA